MNRKKCSSLIVMFLLFTILIGCLSCGNRDALESKLATAYTTYSSARSKELDVSGVAGFGFIDANVCGEDVVLLSYQADAVQMIFYDRLGNVLETSQPIPIDTGDVIYDFFSSGEDRVCLLTGKMRMNESLDGYLYNDLTIQTLDRRGLPLKAAVVIPFDFDLDAPVVVGNSAGDIYVLHDTAISCYHPDGSFVFRNDYEKHVELRKIGDIPVVEADSKLLPVMAGKTDFSGADEVKNLYSYETSDSADGLFFYNMAGVFAYDFEKKEEVMVLRWNDSDLDYSYASSRTYILKKDLFLVSQYKPDGSESLTLMLPSTEAPAVDVTNSKPKNVITIAGYNILTNPMPETTDLVVACKAYQEAHPDVEIEIIDYSQEYGYEQGKTQFCLDVLTKDAADIYFYSPYDFDVDEEIAFADLQSFITSDPEFSTEDYYWDIVTANQSGEQLFSMPLAFGVGAMVGPKTLLGDIDSWTLSEFMALDDTLPEGFILTADGKPSQNLAAYLEDSIDAFIDPVTGEIDLENDTFYEALEYATRFAFYDDKSQAQINTDTLVLSNHYISGIQAYGSIFLESKEPPQIIGSPENSGKLKASIDRLMSISASTDDREVSWDILKFFLTEDMQTLTLDHFGTGVYGIPINRDADKWQIGYFDHGSETGSITNEYRVYTDDYLAFVDSIDAIDPISFAISDLVEEEAPYYFSGQKSKEELARVLENRILLLLSEDR